MKKRIRFSGFVAIAVIGFLLAACGGGDGGGFMPPNNGGGGSGGGGYTPPLAAGLYAKVWPITVDDTPIAGVAENDVAAAITYVKANPGAYTLLINQDVNEMPQILDVSNCQLTIIGIGGKREIKLSFPGALFTVGKSSTDTTIGLMLGNNITLVGRTNTDPVVCIQNGAKLVMETGSKITGNNNVSNSGYCSGGVEVGSGTFTMKGGEISNNTGVFGGVASGGTFIMEGGEICNNAASGGGGGVYVYSGTFAMEGGEICNNAVSSSGGGVEVSSGTFIMEGGKICNNAAGSVGGVLLGGGGTFTMKNGEISGNTGNGVFLSSGTFIMKNGEISGNTATKESGGGVSVNRSCIFIMEGGKISNNTTSNLGGGVYTYGGVFTMKNGEISGNTATNVGGGVYVADHWDNTPGKFQMVSGIIYGNTESDPTLRNNTIRGAALYKDTYGVAQYGTFSGTFSSLGNLTTTDNTIKYLNGVAQ